MTLCLTNTMKRTTEPFAPAKPDHVAIYVCGPTVCAQVLERPPDLRGVTRRLSPRPPYPAAYQPGTLTVLTKGAERRTE